MDTNIECVRLGTKYQRHPDNKKLEIVRESYEPGTSVARIARMHGVNANQVFAWRKAFREGILGGSTPPVLLPVNVVQEPEAMAAIPQGQIEIVRGATIIRVTGTVCAKALSLVLECAR
jgi:transposase